MSNPGAGGSALGGSAPGGCLTRGVGAVCSGGGSAPRKGVSASDTPPC